MKLICIFFLIGILLGCNKLSPNKNPITKIEIATGGCMRMDQCPAFGLIIDSSLAFKYYGGYKSKLQGYYEGSISQEFWDTLNMKLEKIHYEKLSQKNELVLDAEQAESIIYSHQKKTHIFKVIEGETDGATKVLRWILDSYQKVQLIKTKDTIHFDTTFQSMRPPVPKMEQVKFPPPEKHH